MRLRKRAAAWRGASTTQRVEQSCRKLASTNTVEREEDAQIQVGRSSTEVFGCLRIDLSAYSTEKTSFTCFYDQTCHATTNALLARDDWD